MADANPSNETEPAIRDDALSALGGAEGDAHPLRVNANGAAYVVGADTAGSAVGTQVVLVGGDDGTNAQAIAVDSGGQVRTNNRGATATDLPIAVAPTTVGGRASQAAPSDVSADDDVQDIWLTRAGATVIGGIDGSTSRTVAVNASGQLEIDIAAQQGAALDVSGATVTVDLGANNDVQGDVAHDTADSGNPNKIGGKALDFGADPTEVADNDRTDAYFTRAGQQFVIGGHPNILLHQTNVTDADGAQTDTNLLSGATGATDRCVVTHITVTCDNANTADVQCRIGFGAAATPGNDADDVLISHPGIAAGSGVSLGDGSGILGVGAEGEDLFLTCEDPAGGAIDIVVGYFIIDSS